MSDMGTPRAAAGERPPRPVDIGRIQRAQRRRVLIWGVLTAVLWVLAAAFLVAWLYSYLVYLHPIFNELLTGGPVPPEGVRLTAPWLIVWLKVLLWWPVLLLAAGGSTVGLLLYSRRVTLRQIQQNLAQISAALERLERESRRP